MNDRSLIVLRDSVQRSRLMYENILRAMDQKRMDPTYRYIVLKVQKQFNDLEKDMDKAMEDASDDYPIVNQMIKVRGVGKINAMNIAIMIDIHKANTISALWRYAGYAVVNGKAERQEKGKKNQYNKRLKKACYVLALSMIRARSPYKRIYDSAKQEYMERGLARNHAHLSAIRKMIKLFLSHLWIVWRKMEKLPVTEPYYKGKVILPEEMGWISQQT